MSTTYPVTVEHTYRGSENGVCMGCRRTLGQHHSEYCYRHHEMSWAERLPFQDLRSQSRNSDKVETNIYVLGLHDSVRYRWLRAGEVDVHRTNEARNYEWVLKIPAGRGARDYDHRASSAAMLSLQYVSLSSVIAGYTHLRGLIPPHDEYVVCVPRPGESIFEGGGRCSACDEPHPFTSYAPEADSALDVLLGGRRIEVVIGPPLEDE